MVGGVNQWAALRKKDVVGGTRLGRGGTHVGCDGDPTAAHQLSGALWQAGQPPFTVGNRGQETRLQSHSQVKLGWNAGLSDATSVTIVITSPSFPIERKQKQKPGIEKDERV